MTENTNNDSYNLIEESTVPLYFQLMTNIKRKIKAGILKPGDMIPSESKLCSQYNLSRTTVRQALNLLVDESLLIRRRGKGSFIATPKLHRNLNHLYSFTEDMLSMDIKPYSNVLEKAVITASEDIRSALNLTSEKTQVFKLTRLRLANDEPLLLETTYIPAAMCPGILDEDFTDTSLYIILRNKYNLNLHRAVETYEAVKLDVNTSSLLHCKPSSPAFNIQRIGYLNTGNAFELTSSITRSDICVFEVELYTDKNKINFIRKISL